LLAQIKFIAPNPNKWVNLCETHTYIETIKKKEKEKKKHVHWPSTNKQTSTRTPSV
jgi:hypothetical protein